MHHDKLKYFKVSDDKLPAKKLWQNGMIWVQLGRVVLNPLELEYDVICGFYK